MKMFANKTGQIALTALASLAMTTAAYAPVTALADDSTVIVDTEEVSGGSVSGTIGPSEDNRVIVVNAAESISPTSFVIDNAPFILAGVIVVGGLTFIVITNKRRAERRDA